MGGACILGTHIGPEWDAPVEYRQNLENYIDSVPHDQLVYVKSPRRDGGEYQKRAGEEWTVDSDSGYVREEDMSRILDEFSTIHHVGGYFGMCYRNTWESLVDEVYRDAREGPYQVIIPTDCVTDNHKLLKDQLWKPLDGAVEYRMAGPAKDLEFYLPETDDAHTYHAHTQRDSTPLISWTLGTDVNAATPTIEILDAGQ